MIYGNQADASNLYQTGKFIRRCSPKGVTTPVNIDLVVGYQENI
tara:strand:+ start:335 stop:466 length:132 start_codon:yes stop_codon:yes gene_type:complete